MRALSFCLLISLALAGCGASEEPPRDSDGDGIADFLEWRSGTDPHAVDSDGDGLDDAQEEALGTDPLAVDTDGGGDGDGNETAAGTDPNDPLDDGPADPDGDGLSNDRERDLGTDAHDGDSDGDCIGDGEDPDPLRADPVLPRSEDRSAVGESSGAPTRGAWQSRTMTGPVPCVERALLELDLGGSVEVRPWTQRGWRLESELSVTGLDAVDDAEAVLNAITLLDDDGEDDGTWLVSFTSRANEPPRAAPRVYALRYGAEHTLWLPDHLFYSQFLSDRAPGPEWAVGSLLVRGLVGGSLGVERGSFAAEFHAEDVSFQEVTGTGLARASVRGSVRDLSLTEVEDHIVASVRPTGTGTITLQTTSIIGDGIELTLPVENALGYDVEAHAERGEVVVELPDVVRRNTTEDASDFLGRSAFFDDRAIQVTLRVDAADEDILIAPERPEG